MLLSDVAKVQIGFMPRLGIAGRDDTTDIVTGIVLMQKFERTMEVVKRVRAAVERINSDGSLPPGVQIDAFYDRGDLVAITVQTVLHNMLFGIALIFAIQWMFLGDLRCAIIVSATIPVALFLAVMITVLRGESANLLSIGAIDLGIIVDATVIMMENIFRHLAHDHPSDKAEGASIHEQASSHPYGRGRSRPADLLLGDHHHRGVPAAVHYAGRRGPDLRPDVAHLCLCADRRGDRDLHGDAGAVVDPAARQGEGGRDHRRAADPPVYQPILFVAVRHYRISALAALGLPRGVRRARDAAWHRIPAQARRRQYVDSRRHAADHQSGGRHGYGCAHPQHHQELPAGADGVLGAGSRR